VLLKSIANSFFDCGIVERRYKLLQNFNVGLEDWQHFDADDTRVRSIADADDEMLEVKYCSTLMPVSIFVVVQCSLFVVQMLDLTMTFDLGADAEPTTCDGAGGTPTVVPLIKGGESCGVTAKNKHQYLRKWANFALVKRQEKQIARMRLGFASVLPLDIVNILTAQELELLLCGLPTFSVAELREQTVVHNLEHFDRTLEWFWSTVASMSSTELCFLLQFVTGSSRLPAGGFAALAHKFTIECDGSADPDHLPTAHTCFNKLDLPRYSSQHRCDRAIHMAIAEGNQGFAFA